MSERWTEKHSATGSSACCEDPEHTPEAFNYCCGCCRSPWPPVPLGRQFWFELCLLFRNPCRFTLANRDWRVFFARSRISCMPPWILLVLRVVLAGVQTGITCYSCMEGVATLYFFTTWTNILVSIYFLSLALCSVAACFKRPTQALHREAEELWRRRSSSDGISGGCCGMGGVNDMPFFLRLVEVVSSLTVSAALVTCVTYWAALVPTGEKIRNWTSYFEHSCFVTAALMALASRVPYRLYHLWLGLIFTTCYVAMSLCVAFIPLMNIDGGVGYVYKAMNFEEEPLASWVALGLFSYGLPPLLYPLVWFFLRCNNWGTEPELSSRLPC